MDYLIHHMLRSSAERSPDKEAVVYCDQRLSYGALAGKTAILARGLRDAGVERNDRIGIYLEPSLDQTLSLLATSQAGGVFVPVHHSQFPQQVVHIINDCGMKGLVTTTSKAENLLTALEECETLEFVVLVSDGQAQQFSAEAFRARCYRFEELTESGPQGNVTDVCIEKDLAAILYTSGSTGKPKGVMLSHANILAGASIVSDYLDITASDRTLAILPFTFDAGLNQLMTAVGQRATLVLQNWLFAKDIVRMLAVERITGLAGVPSLWSLLVQQSSGLAKADLPDLRYITNTGGAVPRSLLEQLRKSLPTTDVVLMYGLTEAFRSTYLPSSELDDRPTSMGKAIPNTEILVVNEDGQRCEPGEVGELVHHGPTVSLGYWDNSEMTKQVLRPHPFPAAGLVDVPMVCYSGDLVRMDEDGFLYFVGRRDNQIKCSGFRISPNEVEEVLCQSGKLQEAAVIGISDEVLGQRIKAFVTPREGATVDGDELRAFCSSAMPRHMVPTEVEIMAVLPKTSSGKMDYPALRQLEQIPTEAGFAMDGTVDSRK